MKNFQIDGVTAFWFDWDSRKVSGWSRVKPEVGDRLVCPMESGRIGVFEFTEVRHPGDPPDQYFATVKDLDYA